MKTGSLPERVVLFSGFLKNRGFKVFSSNIIDSLKGLEEIDLSNREDFFAVLRANLVSTDMEWKLFGDLFEEFWQETDKTEEDEKSREAQEEPECKGDLTADLIPETPVTQGMGGKDGCEKGLPEPVTYSPVSSLERKNLAHFQRGDIQIAQLVLKNMISPFRLAVTRRSKRSRKPVDIDFRRILKKSLKTGGIPLELFYKRKKKRLRRLVVLADVSGSMDRYARFVMPFILGLRRMGSKAETFVFSTSLTSITSVLRRLSIDKALERISQEVPEWSGGTRIGYSLHQFNQGFGAQLLNRRTVVVIMSDGWDLGGRDLLRREMEILSQKAYCIMWLNPLAGDPDYRPLCRGMQAALPYVDFFLPANSLQSLKKVGRTLTRVMAH